MSTVAEPLVPETHDAEPLVPENEQATGTSVRRESVRPRTFATRVTAFFRVIKFELLIGLLALLLSLGQYFQSVISIRINITDIWREGYTAETRDRVSKFRYLYKKWVEEYKEQLKTCQFPNCPPDHPDESVKRLIDSEALFGQTLLVTRNGQTALDPRIRQLISGDIALLTVDGERLTKEDLREEDRQICVEENKRCITKQDYVGAALKYRNAIIECLNTAEAVKAVIRSRPLPFRSHLLYSDTLEGRYKDIIDEIRTDLGGFIHLYRQANPGRETPAWFVLTSEESNENDYYVIRSYVFVFLLSIAVVYLLKRLFQTPG